MPRFRSTKEKPRPRRKMADLVNLALGLISIILSLAVAELCTRGYHRYLDGRRITPGEKILAQSNIVVDGNPKDNVVDGLDCFWLDRHYSHPYLGFVLHDIPPCGEKKVNNRGFYGPDYPLVKQPGTFVILLAGGSVAQLQIGSTPVENELEIELNQFYTNDKIKRFVVLSGAIGAWKQPQAFINFALNSRVIDGVITLDGFNEVRSVYVNSVFEKPSSNTLFSTLSGQVDGRKLVFSYFDGALRRWERKSTLAAKSDLVFFLTERLRNKCRELALWQSPIAGEQDRIADRQSRLFAFPSEFPTDRYVDYNLSQYEHYLRLTEAVSRTLGIRTLFLMQPTPLHGKVLTSEEQASIGNFYTSPSFNPEWYDHAEEGLLALRREHLPIYSLRDVFAKKRDTIYLDNVHFNDIGRQLVTNRILELLEKEWHFRRRPSA